MIPNFIKLDTNCIINFLANINGITIIDIQIAGKASIGVVYKNKRIFTIPRNSQMTLITFKSNFDNITRLSNNEISIDFNELINQCGIL